MAGTSTGSLEEARMVVNRLTATGVASRVEKDPAADLTGFLDLQAKQSSNFVETLAQSIRDKSLEHEEGETSRDGDGGQDPLTPARSISLSEELQVKILHPLGPRLLELVFGGEQAPVADDSSESPPEGFVPAVNRHLADAECLHELHRNFVLGLGPSVAVKIAHFLDADHISNLRYVNARG